MGFHRPLRGALWFVAAAALLSAAPAAAQDWKGKARLDGKVVSETGEPVPKAQLTFRLKGKDSGPTVEADSKGRFAYYGFASGDWDVDVTAPGYVTRKTAIHLSELTRIPPMEIKLQKMPDAPPAPAAGAIAPKDTKAEVVPMIEKGNDLLDQKDYAGARAEYERALAAVPGNPIILRAVARTYYAEKKYNEAIATLQKAHEGAPDDVDTTLLLANLQIERGNIEEGKALLDKLPPDTVKDPGIFLNAGIVLLNKKNPAGAWDQFDRAIKIKSDDAEPYFYRGLAALQLKKNAEAKADFQKCLELEPNGSHAADAKDLLKSIR